MAGILFLAAVFFMGSWIKTRWIIYITLHSKHWRERNDEISRVQPGKYKTVFLGNSLTELFYLDHYSHDSTILNCGIVGDFSEGLIERSQTITRLKPRKLFIEIGINDIIEKVSLGQLCDNYRALIGIIKKENPDTKIFIQSNLPVIMHWPGLFRTDKKVNELVREQNENLEKIAAETGAVFIDIYTPLMNAGKKDDLFIWDGIHLTPHAYEVWYKTISPYLYEN